MSQKDTVDKLCTVTLKIIYLADLLCYQTRAEQLTFDWFVDWHESAAILIINSQFQSHMWLYMIVNWIYLCNNEYLWDLDCWWDKIRHLKTSPLTLETGMDIYHCFMLPFCGGYCVKWFNKEPNLEKRVAPFSEDMWPDTETHTFTDKKRVVWCLVFRVWKASWQWGSSKTGFHHVWSTRTLTLMHSVFRSPSLSWN